MKFTHQDKNGVNFQISPKELLLLNSIVQEGRAALRCDLKESMEMELEIRKACKLVFSDQGVNHSV